VKKIVLSALAVASLAGTTFGQSIGPSLGSVELRWVERSTAGFNGQYELPAGATASPANTTGTAPTAAQVTQQDGVVVLLLQARVTGNVGGPAIRGLAAAGFDITTNQAAGGAFRSINVADGTPALNNRGSAQVGSGAAGTNVLGFSQAAAPGAATSDRGVLAPFRSVANNNSTNGAALGVLVNNGQTLNKVTLGAQTGFFTNVDDFPDTFGAYNLLGLDQWVTVYAAIYDISDVTTTRDIVFSVANSASTPPVNDYGFRTWTGSGNTQNGGLDIWALSPAFTSSPTFTVRIAIPAPGSAALLGLGGLVAARRRRTA
jgi:hypothetical protein